MDSKGKGLKLRYFIVVAGFLFVSFSFYFYQIVFTPNFCKQKDYTYLYIPTGSNFLSVLDVMVKDSIIEDKTSFAFLSKLVGYQEKVKPGKYKILKNSNNMNVVRMLKNGSQESIKLTFNNIRTIDEFIEKVADKFEFTHDELKAALFNDQFLKENNLTKETVISIFIPDTYEIFWNTTAEDFIEKLKAESDRFWNSERVEKIKKTKFTKSEIITIASIVEAETNKKDEKSRVAGVYINRINTGMPLQADPTVKFAVGDFSLKRITQEHTSVDNPYNTYKNKGLPPGPINMPSKVTIDAVLDYEKHKYIYFCASPNEIGYHDFAETFDEHKKNAAKYRKYLDALNIH